MSASAIDPRSKLYMAAWMSMIVVFIPSILSALIMFILSAATASLMGADLLALARRLKRLIRIIFFVAVMQSVFNRGGSVLLSAGGVTLLTSGGIEGGLLVLIRMAVLFTTGSMIATSSGRELIQGLVQIKLPYELAFMTSIGIRFIPMLAEELSDALIALQLRGIELGKIKPGKRLRIYGYLLLPVVAGTLAKAQDLAIAMEMRGFRAMPKRTSYFSLVLQKRDVVIMSVTTVAGVFMAFSWFYYGRALFVI